MDYEKKYKEALGWMRDLYPLLHGMVKEDAEYYFPELKESEDEQIRKVLVGWFKRYKEQDTCGSEMFNGIPTDNILTWLEKQVEQKSAWSEEDEENFARVDYACLKVYGGDSYSSDWLRKFLGIHKKWKPSDEQMITLHHVISGCSYDIEPLVELETKLKEL